MTTSNGEIQELFLEGALCDAQFWVWLTKIRHYKSTLKLLFKKYYNNRFSNKEKNMKLFRVFPFLFVFFGYEVTNVRMTLHVIEANDSSQMKCLLLNILKSYATDVQYASKEKKGISSR